MTSIREWLTTLGLPEYEAAFTAKEVTWAGLVELTNEDLRSLGVTSRKHREALLGGIWDLQSELAASLDARGAVALNEGRRDEARTLLEQALGINRKVADAEPHRPRRQRALAVSLNNCGVVAIDEGHENEARRLFEESAVVRQQLASALPQRADLRVELASSYWHLYVLSRPGERRERLQRVRDALPPREANVEHPQFDSLLDKASRAWAELRMWVVTVHFREPLYAATRGIEERLYTVSFDDIEASSEGQAIEDGRRAFEAGAAAAQIGWRREIASVEARPREHEPA
jgi:tetratricopeptide (TPR) repeat protein